MSGSLTKQFREENESLKKAFSRKLDFESEAMNKLRKYIDLEVNSLGHDVNTVREKLHDRVNEHERGSKTDAKGFSGNEHKNPPSCSRFNGAYYTNK